MFSTMGAAFSSTILLCLVTCECGAHVPIVATPLYMMDLATRPCLGDLSRKWGEGGGCRATDPGDMVS